MHASDLESVFDLACRELLSWSFCDDYCAILLRAVLLPLYIVHLTASELLLQFNVDKSYGIAFGLNVGHLPSLCVGDKPLNWSSTVKYLGVRFVSGKHLSIDFYVVKRTFYSAYNCVRKKERKCSDLKCVRKPTKSRLSLTHHANKFSR